MSFLESLSPDVALLSLNAGLLLIYLELNRPGIILPGTLGLVVTLLVASGFFHAPLAIGAFLLGLALLALSTRTRARFPPAIFATAALGYAFAVPAPTARPHLALALFCALFLGMGTSLLTTIAARARQNKGLDLK